jgi:hypothetical protein
MAHTRTSNPLCHVLDGSLDATAAPQDLYLIPLNNEAGDLLNAHFAAYGAYTTVAITQVDTGRGGYEQTNGKPVGVKLDLSA